MRAGLDRFLHTYRLELRLAVFNWVYPLMHAGWLALQVWVFYGKDDRSAQALLETSMGRLAIGMAGLVALFTAGAAASRSQRARFVEMEETYPSGFETLLARGLAGVTAVLSLMLSTVILAALQGPPASLAAGLPLFLAEAALTLAFITSAAWWLVSRFKPGRWAYPMLAGGWLAFMIGPTMLSREYAAANLLNFMRQGSGLYYELYGRILFGNLPAYFNLFYLGLLLFFTGLAAWGYWKQRFHRRSMPAALAMLGALALAVFGAGGYAASVASARSQMQETAEAFVQPHLTSTPEDEIAGVEFYDLAIDLGQPGILQVEASITVRNPGSQPLQALSMILYPSLEIVSADLPFKRQGVHLRFELPEPLPPGESLTLGVRYAGRFWEYGYINREPAAQNFVHPRGVRLSSMVPWYPQFSPQFVLREEGSLAPARGATPGFHVAITGNDRLNFGANIPAVGPGEFRSSGAGWLFLTGSPHLVVEQIGQATLITSRSDLSAAREHVHLYAEPLAHMQRFFPEAGVEGLAMMVLGEEASLPQGTPPSDGRVVVVISRWILTGLPRYSANQEYMIGRALFSDLWRMSGGDYPEDGNLYGISRFLYAHYLADGDPDKMEAAISESSYFEPLMQVYRRRGEQGIARVLEDLRERYKNQPPPAVEQIIEWIWEAGGDL